MSYVPRDSRSLIQSMAARVIARTDLTDLSEGSTLLQILAAIGEELNLSEIRLKRIRDSFFLKNVTGAELDERASEMPLAGLTRHGKTFAQGAVLTVQRKNLTASSGTNFLDPFTLPAGSVFGREDNPAITYVTTDDVLFAGSPDVANNVPGTQIVDQVYIKCTVAGPEGNCDKETITRIVSAPDDVLSVDNGAPAAGSTVNQDSTGALRNGFNRESDEQLKNRIIAYLSSLARCQPSALEFMALQFEDPSGSRAIFSRCHEKPGTPGISWLVVDDGSGLEDNKKAGRVTTGVVPSHGPTILFNARPATEPIKKIKFTDSGGNVNYEVHDNALGQTYMSLHERGLIYFPKGVLTPGDTWQIGSTDDVTLKYEVYTGLVANLQRVVEGSTSNPVEQPGWRAAGTRVLVRPAKSEDMSLDIHVLPKSHIALSNVSEDVINETVSFFQGLGPGDTFFVSQLIDRLMNNPKLVSVNIYEPESGYLKADDPATDHFTAWRMTESNITIVPAAEDE